MDQNNVEVAVPGILHPVGDHGVCDRFDLDLGADVVHVTRATGLPAGAS